MRVCSIPAKFESNGNPSAEILLDASAYMVDNFHIAGHTTNACNPNHPDCEFHHSLRKFEEVANANTECAEQCFAWLKRFKSVVKYMTASRFRFFMHTVISSHNHTIEKRTIPNKCYLKFLHKIGQVANMTYGSTLSVNLL